MADLIDVRVTGMEELRRNLAEFASEKDLGRAVRAALQAGGRITLRQGKANANARGYGLQGIRVIDGRHVLRYGRIPRSLKVGRAFIPRDNADKTVYRVNVLARGQRVKGKFKDRAPHAHFMEYGWTNWRSRARFVGFAFLGPALDATASAAVTAMGASVSRAVDKMKFSTTGKP